MPRKQASKPARNNKRRNMWKPRGNQSLGAAKQSDRQRVSLRWSTDTTTTTLSSWRFGLAQFWNQKPGYYDEYMKLFKMSRLTSVKVKCTVINTTANTPAEVVLVTLPYSDYSRTLAEVKQLPSASIRYLSGSGGLDKVTVQQTGSLSKALRFDASAVRDYQQSASEAASTLALLPDTPVLALYVGGASTEPTMRVFIEVDYAIEFFELEYPGSVAVQYSRTARDMTDTMQDTTCIPTPFDPKPLSGKSTPFTPAGLVACDTWDRVSSRDSLRPTGKEDHPGQQRPVRR